MRSWGIRARLTAANVLLLAAAIAGAGVVAWRSGERLVLEGLEARAMAVAESASRALSFPLAVGDSDGARRQIEAFAADPDVLLIEVSDSSGHVLASSGSARDLAAADGSLSRWAASRPVAATARWEPVSGGGRLYQCLHPIRPPNESAGAPSVGSVLLVVSSRRSAETLSGLRSALLWASALALGLGVAVAHALGGRLVDPLSRLTSAAERVARGQLDVDAPLSGPGEVGRLGEAFDTMTRALRRQSEQLREMTARELARARTDWDATFNAIADMIAVFGEDGHLVKANRAFHIRAEREGPEGEWLRGLTAGPTWMGSAALESTVPCRDCRDIVAGTVHLVATIFPILGDGGQPTGRVLVLRDVTERDRMRDQLVQSEKMSALGLLISGVAHEINNPLAGILGFAELSLRRELHAKVRGYLEKIQVQGERIRRIVQNLLTFARPHAPERSSVRLNELIGQTLDLRAYDHSVSRISVETSLAADLPKFAGDPHQLQQVLMNLIINAEQAMKATAGAGTLKISTRVGSGADIELVVEDDGPGIPPEHLSRLFDPFFTTKAVGEGTGLGLSLVLGIVRDHHGTIRAENRPEGGARFRVTLPLAEIPLGEHEPPRPTPAARGRLVLLVDDEPDLLEATRETLCAEGYRVMAAGDVDAALGLLRREPVDLVLADLRMPGKDGRDLFAAARAETPLAGIPMAFMTGDLANASTRRFLEEHQLPVLAKPWQSAQLLDFVGRQIRPTV